MAENQKNVAAVHTRRPYFSKPVEHGVKRGHNETASTILAQGTVVESIEGGNNKRARTGSQDTSAEIISLLSDDDDDKDEEGVGAPPARKISKMGRDSLSWAERRRVPAAGKPAALVLNPERTVAMKREDVEKNGYEWFHGGSIRKKTGTDPMTPFRVRPRSSRVDDRETLGAPLNSSITDTTISRPPNSSKSEDFRNLQTTSSLPQLQHLEKPRKRLGGTLELFAENKPSKNLPSISSQIQRPDTQDPASPSYSVDSSHSSTSKVPTGDVTDLNRAQELEYKERRRIASMQMRNHAQQRKAFSAGTASPGQYETSPAQQQPEKLQGLLHSKAQASVHSGKQPRTSADTREAQWDALPETEKLWRLQRHGSGPISDGQLPRRPGKAAVHGLPMKKRVMANNSYGVVNEQRPTEGHASVNTSITKPPNSTVQALVAGRPSSKQPVTVPITITPGTEAAASRTDYDDGSEPGYVSDTVTQSEVAAMGGFEEHIMQSQTRNIADSPGETRQTPQQQPGPQETSSTTFSLLHGEAGPGQASTESPNGVASPRGTESEGMQQRPSTMVLPRHLPAYQQSSRQSLPSNVQPLRYAFSPSLPRKGSDPPIADLVNSVEQERAQQLHVQPTPLVTPPNSTRAFGVSQHQNQSNQPREVEARHRTPDNSTEVTRELERQEAIRRKQERNTRNRQLSEDEPFLSWPISRPISKPADSDVDLHGGAGATAPLIRHSKPDGMVQLEEHSAAHEGLGVAAMEFRRVAAQSARDNEMNSAHDPGSRSSTQISADMPATGVPKQPDGFAQPPTAMSAGDNSGWHTQRSVSETTTQRDLSTPTARASARAEPHVSIRDIVDGSSGSNRSHSRVLGKIGKEDAMLILSRRNGMSWRDVVEDFEHLTGKKRSQPTLSKRLSQVQRALDYKGVEDPGLLLRIANGDLEAQKRLNELVHGEKWQALDLDSHLSVPNWLRERRGGAGNPKEKIQTQSPESVQQLPSDPASVIDAPTSSSQVLNLQSDITLSKTASQSTQQSFTRPTTGGKTINADMFKAYLSDHRDALLEDATEDDDADEDTSDMDNDDYCHFAYQVQRREFNKEDMEDDDFDPAEHPRPWVSHGQACEVLEMANAKAAREVATTRSSRMVGKQEHFNLQHAFEEDGRARLTLINLAKGMVQVRVQKFMRSFHDGVLPKNKDLWAPRMIYFVKERIEAKVNPQGEGELFVDPQWAVEQMETDGSVYTLLELANCRAVERFVSRTVKFAGHLGKYDAEIQEQRGKLMDELENGEINAEFEKEMLVTETKFGGHIEKTIRVWVEKGKLEGPRNL